MKNILLRMSAWGIFTFHKKYNSLCCVTIFLMHTTISAYNVKPPRLTVVLVVDQFAHHYIDKLYPYLKYGLKYLIDHGVVYTNAYWTSGQPGTATGHAGLNTGVNANYHGFVSNTWYEDGEKVACDDDDSPDARVISPDGVYDYGKSGKRLMVDGLSDQCVLQTEPHSAFSAYSISMKSRSAIATAGKLGKPLWFDCESGTFTSSEVYFNELPQWVKIFNNGNNPKNMGSVVWEPLYSKSPYAYRFFNINNYEYTRSKETLLGKTLALPDESNPDNPYHMFEKTPFANQLILNCALACIKKHVSRKHRDRLLLWVCLSPLDKIGHQYGPNSMEAIDMIYRLDKQLQRFIRQTLRVIGKHELMFVLTADHGIMPIPELLQEEGLPIAERIDRVKFVKNINETMKEKHSLKNNIVISYKSQELVLNQDMIDTMDSAKRAAIVDDIKLCALNEQGIKNAWTYDELIHLPTQVGTLEDNIKKQLFRGRTGSIIIEPYPYVAITHWPQGACHKTPYNYDTHVPLIVFHPGKFEKRYVRERVCPLQLANTIAEILNVPKPSASVCEILPELFDPSYK
jgi:predicted AlkP superfamily pyrophosphatase or phosphodiesterase